MRLKDAMKLFEQAKYEECCQALEDLTLQDPTLYDGFVLKGYCLRKLEKLEDACDAYFSAVAINSKEAIAWQGLVDIGLENNEDYCTTIIQACLVLLKCFQNANAEHKYLRYSKVFIETIARTNLTVPLKLTTFDDICHKVLQSESDNFYAMEMFIRLKLECFLTNALPLILDRSVCSADDYEVLKMERFSPSIQNILNDYLLALESIIINHDISGTLTLPNTVSLGKILILLIDFYINNKVPNDLPILYHNVLDEFTIQSDNCSFVDNINLNERLIDLWSFIEQELQKLKDIHTDLHAQLLSLLVSLKLHQSDRFKLLISDIQNIFTILIEYHCQLADGIHSCTFQPSCEALRQKRSFPFYIPFRHIFLTPSKFEEYLQVLHVAHCIDNEIIDDKLDQPSLTLNTFNLVDSSIFDVLLLELYVCTNCHTQAERIQKRGSLNFTSSPRKNLCIHWLKALKLDVVSSVSSTAILNFINQIRTELLPPTSPIYSGRDYFILGQIFNLLCNHLTEHLNELNDLRGICLKSYFTAIQLDPVYYRSFYKLGRIFQQLDQSGQALIAYARALKLNCTSPECVYQYAVALSEHKEWEKAYDVFDGIKYEDFSTQMWLTYGLIALRLGRLYESLKAIQYVVKQDPENALYREILGEIYLSRGSYDTAIRCFKHALKLDPTHPLTSILCGRAYRAKNDYYYATAYFHDAVNWLRKSCANHETYENLYILAVKELVEVKLYHCQTNMLQGLVIQGLDELNEVLNYAAEIMEFFVGSKPVPFWLLRHVGTAFTLVSVIEDPNFTFKIPQHLLTVLRDHTERVEILDHSLARINVSTSLELADIYFGLTLISWLATFDQTLRNDQLPNPQTQQSLPMNTGKWFTTACILINIGLNNLVRVYRMKRHYVTKDNVALTATPEFILLTKTIESTLKQSIKIFDQLHIVYDNELNQVWERKRCFSPGMINLDDESDEQLIKSRLSLLTNLRSSAWSGLAGLYYLFKKEYSDIVSYCLYQSLLSNANNYVTSINLSMHLLEQGHADMATKLIEHAKSSTPQKFRIWQTSAKIKAILHTGLTGIPNVRRYDPFILSDLIHAGQLGINCSLAVQLPIHLLPSILDHLCSSYATAVHLSTADTMLAYQRTDFLSRALAIASELINRATAFQPNNFKLWHCRGILLQLSGLSYPARHCLKRALELINSTIISANKSEKIELENSKRLIEAHCYLINHILNTKDSQISCLFEIPSIPCNTFAEVCAWGLSRYFYDVTEDSLYVGLNYFTTKLDQLAQDKLKLDLYEEFPKSPGKWLALCYNLDHYESFQLNWPFTASLAYCTTDNFEINGRKSASSPLVGYNLIKRFSYLHKDCLPKDLLNFSILKQKQYANNWNFIDSYATMSVNHLIPISFQLSQLGHYEWIYLNAKQLCKVYNAKRGQSYILQHVALSPSDPSLWYMLIDIIVEFTSMVTYSIFKILSHCLKMIEPYKSTYSFTVLSANTVVRLAEFWLKQYQMGSLANYWILIYADVLNQLRHAAVLFPYIPCAIKLLKIVSDCNL